MNLANILNAKPTITTYASQEIVTMLMLRDDFRCYSSVLYNDIEALIDRYLSRHARVPGISSPDTRAIEPLEVFYWIEEEKTYKGALFGNGAVLSADLQETTVLSLFIDETVAYRWGYPEEGFVVPSAGDEQKDEA